MAEYRIFYSRDDSAREKGFPPKGTVVEFGTHADLDALMARFGCGLVVHEPGWEPWWIDGEVDVETGEYVDHEDWRGARWIEVYNGYRE